MSNPSLTPASASSSQPAERLDSWKEIARYLNRDESTVQRWEKREGMPVHRHVHDKRGSVYAYPAELDVWWQGRRQQLEPKNGNRDIRLALRDRRRWWVGIAAVVVLLPATFFALKSLSRRSVPAPEASRPLVRLTSTSGVNIDPAVSADGSLVAYASDRGGSGDLDIWVQPIHEERPRRVTREPGDELEPSFSPATGSIVYSKGDGAGIYIIEASGGEPRLLAAAVRARTPRFSPDGRWVTYWTGPPVWVTTVTHATGLFVVPASGGASRRLASEFGNARYGAWSPDGEKILFVGARERDPNHPSLDWYIVSANGGEPIRTGAVEVLRARGLKGVPIPGAWSRDGAVVFGTYDEGASNVWQLRISPATGRVDGEPARLTFGTAIERGPAVTRTGQVLFASIAENVDVWRLPLNAKTGLASGAIERVTDNAANDRLMNMSDDGRTMAFLSSRTGQDELWIRDMHTGRDRQITSSNARGGRVTRDGSMVAVARNVSEGRGIDLVPATGGRGSPLCDDCTPGDWSPDGTRLVVQRGDPARLFVRDTRSGREMEVAAHPTWNLFQPRFSPDGRWIVFHTTNAPSLRQIYAVPAFSNVAVPVDAWIPIVADFGVHPSWASDGSAIYYFSPRDGALCAWLQPLDPRTKRPVGSPQAVQHFHEPRLRGAAAAQPNNHVAAGYLYVTLTASASNIWMLAR